MRRRVLGVMAGTFAAALSAGALAYALSCAFPVGQRAELELVSVTVDGAPQQDLTRYRDLRVTVSAEAVAGEEPRGVHLYVLAPGNQQYFQERFSDPNARDR